MLAAGGYPSGYDKGFAISGLDTADSATQKVFHAGTAIVDDEARPASGEA